MKFTKQYFQNAFDKAKKILSREGYNVGKTIFHGYNTVKKIANKADKAITQGKEIYKDTVAPIIEKVAGDSVVGHVNRNLHKTLDTYDKIKQQAIDKNKKIEDSVDAVVGSLKKHNVNINLK
jgi:hypothetical protein